jgi:hypothetical protein
MERKERESDPQGGSRRSPVFETGAVASRLAFPRRMTDDTITSGFSPPIPFPAGAGAPVRFIIHERRAEQSKPTPCGAHSLAARPGAPCPVHSPCVRAPPRIRTANLCLLRAAPLPVGLEGHGADDRSLSARRDLNPQHLGSRPSLSARLEYEHIGSRHPVSSRTSCLTGAGPQPCAAAKLGHPGLEPGSSGFRVRRARCPT